jgi:hypothetical protein
MVLSNIMGFSGWSPAIPEILIIHFIALLFRGKKLVCLHYGTWPLLGKLRCFLNIITPSNGYSNATIIKMRKKTPSS